MTPFETKPVTGVTRYDLIVVGGTPAGIVMAVRSAREGLRVLLVHHTRHLGGMLANGLGVWDTRYEGKRSPLYDEIRSAFFDHYCSTYGSDSAQYRDALPGESGHTNGKFEPRVAAAILDRLVRAEPGISLLLEHHLVAIERQGSSILRIMFSRMDRSATIAVTACVFADCSYEADTLPLAGIAYRIGRESMAEHGEPHAGVIYMQPKAGLPDGPAMDEAWRKAALKLRVFDDHQRRMPGSTGDGDGNVQAMNYRVILSRDPERRRPIERPASYERTVIQALEWGYEIEGLPNKKIGLNRPQLIGPHMAYVEGSWEVRRRVMDAHWNAAMAAVWHRQNDPEVSPEERARWREYGLATDEFPDNGNRPHEIYCREGRRLQGRSLLTQADTRPARNVLRAPIHADSIAFTEWYVDSHACTTRRLPGSLEEGKVMLYQETFPGQVPIGSILPREVDNLLVPVCLSATHVAWNTVRLEPTWMHIAESAAWVAILAVRSGRSPAAVNRDELLRLLARKGVMLAFFNDLESDPRNEFAVAAQYFANRGFFPDYDARLDEPIRQATARLWVRAGGDPCLANANETARNVFEADRSEGPFASSADLAALLPGGLIEREIPRTVTRGEVLLRLWKQINRTLSP